MPVEVLTSNLTVWVGGPSAVAALPSEGQLLLVEADPDQALRLKQELRGRQQVAVCAEVLAQQSGTPLRWYAFNDPRLNGPLDEQAWRERYPNLRRIGEEQRIGRRLEEVLNAWARQQQGSPEPLTLSLQLRQGDPLVALEGLGRWIAALQSVQLVMPAAREIWGQSVQAWLADRGFKAVEELAAPTWRRDPLATQRLQLQQKEQQIAELEEQLASQAVRLLLGQTRHEELQGQLGEQSEQRAALGVRCEELQVRCEELEGQRDVFLAERDNLQEQLRGQQQQTSEQSQQRVVLQEEVEALRGQLSAQSAQTVEQSEQRAALGVRCEELQVRCEELQGQRDVFLAERDNLQEQLRGQQQQTSEQSQQRVELQEQVETLQGQLSAQSAQTSEQSQQREALGVRCEELQTLLSAQQAANSQLQSDREVLAKERDEWRGKAEAQEGRLQAINQELDEILALLDAGTTDSPAADVEPIGQAD